MMIFLCKALTGKIALSKAHAEYRWFDLKSTDGLQDWLVPIAKDFHKYKLGEFVS